jgi:FAD:protein FMN transferase
MLVRLLSLTLVLLSAATTSAALEKLTFHRPLMGTRFTVVCFADDPITADRASNPAFALAEKLNALASDYLPASELSLLSSQPIGHPLLGNCF